MPQLLHWLLLLPLILSVARAAPFSDEEAPHPCRRDAAGIKPRHLRPYVTRRDSIVPPDIGQIANFNGSQPEPQRGATGGTFSSTDTNEELDSQNLDNVAPPTTDAGNVPNLKWSFSLSHSRLLKGGWVREQAITDLPPSKDIAAAELRLSPNAYRELHWHRVAEWGYILNGTGRISAIDEQGRSYISDIRGPSNGTDPDIYYFPPGVPHSIQALGDGLELLIIFTDGDFDRLGTTFMLSDWLAHTPLDILAQNFGLNSIQQPKTIAKGGGGWTKIQDSVTNFPVSTQLASGLVYIEPNGLRELHWHTADEWLYIIQGHGRATAFAGSGRPALSIFRFVVKVGDTGVFPVSYGHYMKNLSPTEPLIFLEIFKADRFVDFSATQWLALSPPQVVADLLNISVATVQKLKQDKQSIVAE
ncbi:RmlC-like cupin domain-containing protein [Infundibulicybe gibba]|nr:RmlC-like cupin domain-containing protein [Infundibulicybe gibba]